MTGLHLTPEECEAIADGLEDGAWDNDTARTIAKTGDRNDLTRVACTIAQDRYSAGSNAARAALIILLKHGMQAATDFVADLEHHEG